MWPFEVIRDLSPFCFLYNHPCYMALVPTFTILLRQPQPLHLHSKQAGSRNGENTISSLKEFSRKFYPTQQVLIFCWPELSSHGHTQQQRRLSNVVFTWMRLLLSQQNHSPLGEKRKIALAAVLSRLGRRPITESLWVQFLIRAHTQVAGLIPYQGTYLGCGFDPRSGYIQSQSRHVQDATN